MAHTICGIDVGSYSIKFAFFEVGFRTKTLRGLLETAVPAGEAPLLQRQMDAVREGLAQVSGEVTPYFALPGDQLSVRVLELPFSDSRKIDQVVGYELEGEIVHAIEDVVFDHLVVGQRPEGSTVMAAAARRDDLADVRGRRGGSRHPPARAVRGAADLPHLAAVPRGRRGGGAHPVPGGARLRTSAHQHLLRSRRRSDCRADDPARRRAPDRGDREGVQRRRRARRAGEARRRVPRQPGAAGDDAAEHQAGHRDARDAGADDPRAAPDAGRLPRGQPIRHRRVAGGGRRRPAGRSAAVPGGRAGDPGPVSFDPPGAGIGRPEVRRRRGRGGRRARIRHPRAGLGDRDSARAAARARSTSAAGRSSTAPASRSCARRRRTSRRWRVRC